MEESGKRLDRETRLAILTERIDELERVVAALKDVRDNPDIGEMKLCSKHNLDWKRFRRYVYETTWHKKRTALVATESKMLETMKYQCPTMSWYDKLWCEVTGIELNEIGCTPTDLAETFEYLFKTKLTPREVKVIRMRYQELHTLNEIGEELHVSRSMVAIIEQKAIRKLHDAQAWLIYGHGELIPFVKIQRDLERDIELKTKQQVLSELDGTVPSLKKLIIKGIMAVIDERHKGLRDSAHDLFGQDAMNVTIESLDFSVRTYNCLGRGGIKTVADIVNMGNSKLKKLRNLGRKSYGEVIDKLARYGVYLPDDED